MLSPQRCHNLRKTTKAQNLLNRQSRQSKASQTAIVQALRSETGKNATRSQSSHGQNKLSSRQRQQNQAKHGVFLFQALCLCVFTFGAGGRVCVCVTANVFLVWYWTSKRGLCLKSVFYWEPTIGERVESKAIKEGKIVWILNKETITSLNRPEHFQ